MFDSECFSSEK
uniref:Uncharacterized protein n=1 Tax=Lepeophtheirus salmonis TaxID=72036 RepID=A0A0K2TTD1_LEPSM